MRVLLIRQPLLFLLRLGITLILFKHFTLVSYMARC
jgi:hypothetical protein